MLTLFKKDLADAAVYNNRGAWRTAILQVPGRRVTAPPGLKYAKYPYGEPPNYYLFHYVSFNLLCIIYFLSICYVIYYLYLTLICLSPYIIKRSRCRIRRVPQLRRGGGGGVGEEE